MGESAAVAERTWEKVVFVDPKPRSGVLSWLIDVLEAIVIRVAWGNAVKRSQFFLSGNHAPVPETPPVTDLPVRGFLPECLNGEFVRVGPNPNVPPVAMYHWFDGDGMVHALRIQDGKATYLSRFVRTSRLKQEEFYGRSKFMKVGDLQGLFGLFSVTLFTLREKLKILDLSYGNGTANTNMIYHNGQLLALQEADKPYVLKVLEDGDLQTVGLMDYDKRLQHAFTAHPKIDPFTGEMFTFGYNTRATPYCTYRIITKEGVMLDPVPITLSDPVMMHDFAITENFAIFMDLPLIFTPREMAKGGLIFKFDKTKKARFGLLPRYAKDELQMRWFELPSCYIFHNANAWEEEDEVVLITCRLENPNLQIISGTNSIGNESYRNELYEMRFNVKTGEASQKKLSESAVDFPRINESYTGRKQRYVYGTILDKVTMVKAIVKFDLYATPECGKTSIQVGGNVQGIYDLGPGRFGSEAVFVPKQQGLTSEEDDGYLIFFVYDEKAGKSEVHVIDAKTMSKEPVAVVELPSRVPFGFHAFFVTEEQLKQQRR